MPPVVADIVSAMYSAQGFDLDACKLPLQINATGRKQ